MKTKLDILLSQIHPERTYDQISGRVDQAINSFRFELSPTIKMPEFKRICADFYCHIESRVLRLSQSIKPDVDMDWGRFYNQLVKIYGHNGEKTAFEISISNNEGGIYAVFKSVANAMVEFYAGNEINARVYSFWNNLSVKEKFEVMDCFLPTLQNLFPNEIKMHGTARIKANFPKYLIEYPRMLKRTRDMASNF